MQHNTVYSQTSSNVVKRITFSNISKQNISYNVRNEKNREFYDLFNKKLETMETIPPAPNTVVRWGLTDTLHFRFQ